MQEVIGPYFFETETDALLQLLMCDIGTQFHFLSSVVQIILKCDLQDTATTKATRITMTVSRWSRLIGHHIHSILQLPVTFCEREQGYENKLPHLSHSQ